MMYSSASILVAVTLVVSSLASPIVVERATPETIATINLPLHRAAASSGLSKRHHKKTGLAHLKFLGNGHDLVTEVTIGHKKFNLLVATTFSDTFVWARGFQCLSTVNDILTKVPQSVCEVPQTYDYKHSHSFHKIHDQNFNISFGGGATFYNGILGKDRVTLAGITVPDQEIAVVTVASEHSLNTFDGYLGLAFPEDVSAYPGTDPTKDVLNGYITYSPIFTTMVEKNLVKEPIFSLAVERGDETKQSVPAGSLALGGIPPGITYRTPLAVKPIEYLVGTAHHELAVYQISVDGITYTDAPKSAHATGFQVILDTSLPVNYIPTAYAKDFNSKFQPPAYFNETFGGYFVKCDAKAPEFAFNIDGQAFPMNSLDSILLPRVNDDPRYDTPDGDCLSTIQDGGPGPVNNVDAYWALGAPFFRSALVIFDEGKKEIRIGARDC